LLPVVCIQLVVRGDVGLSQEVCKRPQAAAI